MAAIRVLEYLERSGRSPWRRWFNDLDAIAAAKVGTAWSTKKRQSAAIGAAHKAWEGYKQRRKKGAAWERAWH